MSLQRVLILCLVGLALSNDEAFMRSLEQNQFGKTILQTIQLELQSNNSIDHVINLLTEMKTAINDEQDSEREKSREHTQFCIDKFNEILFVVDRAGLQLARDKLQQPLLLEEQKDKMRQVRDKQELETRNNQQLQVLLQGRQQTRSEYEKSRDELTSLISALSEAKRQFKKLSTKKWDPLAGTYSFIEKLQQYKSKKGYGAMLDVLLEVAQQPGLQANQKGVDKIQEIITELIDSIYNVQRQETLADDAREQDYQNQKERLDLQNRRLEATIATLNAKVLTINQSVLELSNDISSNTELSFLKNKEKDDWQKQCLDYHNHYVGATATRTQESDILTEVIQVLNRKYDDLISLLQTMNLQ